MAVNTKRKVGRPSLGHPVDRHAVATKFVPPHYEKLERLAAKRGLKPGPFVSEYMARVLDLIDDVDELNANQEALPIVLP